MNRDDIQKLVGGYATGSLTEAERKLLMEAALEDQELFEELAREDELRELLAAPGVRDRLADALAPDLDIATGVRPGAWWTPFQPNWQWAAAGAVGLAVLIGLVAMRPSTAPVELAQSETKVEAVTDALPGPSASPVGPVAVTPPSADANPSARPQPPVQQAQQQAQQAQEAQQGQQGVGGFAATTAAREALGQELRAGPVAPVIAPTPVPEAESQGLATAAISPAAPKAVAVQPPVFSPPPPAPPQANAPQAPAQLAARTPQPVPVPAAEKANVAPPAGISAAEADSNEIVVNGTPTATRAFRREGAEAAPAAAGGAGPISTGAIAGSVSDPAGGVIRDARLELVNPATGVRYQSETGAAGDFAFAQLPAGNYELTAQVPGFRTYVQQNLGVQTAQTVRVDAVLEVGTAAESVTVADAAPLLTTESAAGPSLALLYEVGAGVLRITPAANGFLLVVDAANAAAQFFPLNPVVAGLVVTVPVGMDVDRAVVRFGRDRDAVANASGGGPVLAAGAGDASFPASDDDAVAVVTIPLR